jgi:hypothetical protein
MMSNKDATRGKGNLEPVFFWTATMLLVITLAPLFWSGPLGLLDSSWGSVLYDARGRGLGFGKELVFTYGPLGYVQVGSPADGRWATTFWPATALTLLAIAPVAMLMLQRPRAITVGLAALLLAFPSNMTGSDALVPAGLMAWGLLTLTAGRDRRWSLLGLAMLAGYAGLIKFTWLVAGLATLLAVAGDLVIRRRFQEAAVLLLGGIIIFLAGWLYAGQPLGNLPAFLRGSWQVAAGYSETMGMPGPRDVLLLQAVSIGLVLWNAAVAVWHITLPTDDRSLVRRGLLFSWLVALTFLAWKHGVVRSAEGSNQAVILVAWSVVAGFCLAVIPAPSFTVARRGLWRACAIAGLAVAMVYRTGRGPLETHLVSSPQRLLDHARMLVGSDPRQANAARAFNDQRDQLALPTTKTIVGKASLDVFGYLQDYAIANKFNYTPRPVFQSYSAYSRALQQLNDSFYLGDMGPRFVLLALTPIDGRFPPLEDAASLRTILRNYRLVGREEPFLVVEREGAEPAARELIVEGRAEVGERVPIKGHDADDLWLEIDLRYSLCGRLESLLLKPQPCQIRIWSTADQGEGRSWNAPAAMLAAGFIASPLLEGTGGVATALVSGPTRRLRAFAVDARRVKGGEYSWRLYKIRGGLVGHPTAPEAAMEYPGFVVRPETSRSESLGMIVNVAGVHMLKLDPPSEITIAVPHGALAVEGRFALMAEAYLKGATDGADFVIEMKVGDKPAKEIYRRLLDPANHARDTGPQKFTLSLPDGNNRRITLRTGRGPAGNGNWDWTCWSDVRFMMSETPPK